MAKSVSLSEDLIAAVATPFVEGAIGIIRLSGAGCVDACAAVFSRPERLQSSAGYRVHHGFLQDPEVGDQYDEVLVTVFRAPFSYTGQESVEISCHGSVAGLQAIMALLLRNGFRQAEPGEFTLRAFLNGKMDLTEAEAVQEIVAAKTRTAHSLALSRLTGSVFERIDNQKQKLVECMAAIAVQLDYPEDEIDAVELSVELLDDVWKELAELAATYRSGRLYQEGIRVALAGRTNAGKSSLFNLLLREDRAIVSDQHGTTRDYIETLVNIDGLPVRLFDTAGLRLAAESIESEGIRRSEKVIQAATLVVYVIDSNQGVHADDTSQLKKIQEAGIPCIAVWNKIDVAAGEKATVGSDSLNGILEDTQPVYMSAQTGEGLQDLHRAIVGAAGAGQMDSSSVVIDSERQHVLLQRAISGLEQVKQDIADQEPLDVVALDLQDVLDALGEITGEVFTEHILDKMFARFCLGK